MSDISLAHTMPEFLNKYSEKELFKHRQRFLIHLASLYATQEGGVDSLCFAIGKKKNFLARYIRITGEPEKIPAEVAVAIEKCVGRHIVPREELAPHIFK